MISTAGHSVLSIAPSFGSDACTANHIGAGLNTTTAFVYRRDFLGPLGLLAVSSQQQIKLSTGRCPRIEQVSNH